MRIIMEKLGVIVRVLGSNIALLLRKVIGTKITYRIKALISPSASLRTFGIGQIKFGNKVEIRPNTELTARNGTIKIGNNCFINRNCMLVAHESIVLEEDVTIGPGTVIYDHDHDGNGGYVTKNIVIKSGAWIGANVVILKGVTIGKSCIVGAGSIVTKDIPDGITFFQKREAISGK